MATQLISRLVENLKQDPKVWGVLLVGSHARGDALPGADIDLWILLREVLERRFRGEQIEGHWVEFRFNNLNQARMKMQQDPTELYSHLDGKILFDPDFQLKQLAEHAQEGFAGYHLPDSERKELVYHLATAQRKLQSALNHEDSIRMGYLASTHCWKILEGLWAANHKPMPPSASVGKHLGTLELPLTSSDLATSLFDAPAQIRAKTALDLVSWILPRIS